MHWHISHRAHPTANRIAKRHYTCQTPDSPQFVKPGSCVVLMTSARCALWVTSWQAYIDHEWKDTWECSTFRNEGSLPSSLLITQAIAATRYEYGDPPAGGMITMVAPGSVPGFLVRRPGTVPEMRWGYCYWQAGFEFAGWTKSGKYVLRLPPERFPLPEPAWGAQMPLLGQIDGAQARAVEV